MKTLYVAIGIGVVVVAGTWCGRAAWRTHHKLVTLHVRNAPLKEVVRSIEKQTREKVRVDPMLDAKVTLDVKNRPLAEVLDQVADQSGARWGTTYAVFGSENALRRLESVLRQDTDLETAGWTNLAPRFTDSEPPPGAHIVGGGPIEVVTGSPDGGGGTGLGRFESEDTFRDVQQAKQGTTVTTNQDGSTTIITKSPGGATKVIRMGPGSAMPGDLPDGGPPHKMRQVMVRKGPNGTTTTTTDSDGQVRTTRTSSDGKVLKEDQWSAQRLVLDNSLSSKLRGPMPTKATPESAAQTARTVGGKVTTYYALEKPPIAVDPSMRGLVRGSGERIMRGGTNVAGAQVDIAARLEEAKQARLQEMSKSPEQQVQRARQKKAAQSGN